MHYRLKEGALIAMGALCLYLWMALLTYDQTDPGWSHTSSNMDQVQNAAGRAGAFAADILFMVLGYFAYIFPLLLAVKTWQIFRQRHEPWQWSGWLFSWRLIGLVFLILSGAALAHIHFHSAGSLPASAGGALGESLGNLALNALNIQGSTLLFIALFLFGLTVFTDLSWFKVMDMTGKITLDLLELMQGSVTRWWAARAERKQLVAQLREVDEPAYAAPRMSEPRDLAKPKPARPLPVEPTLSSQPSPPPRPVAPIMPTASVATNPAPAQIAPSQPARPAVPIKPLSEESSLGASNAKPAEQSARVQKEKQASLFVDSAVQGTLPPISILDPAEQKKVNYSPESLAAVGQLL
ncbi:MAG: cell division protein FtsK, partial [Proteobacteria bacterium]